VYRLDFDDDGENQSPREPITQEVENLGQGQTETQGGHHGDENIDSQGDPGLADNQEKSCDKSNLEVVNESCDNDTDASYNDVTEISKSVVNQNICDQNKAVKSAPSKSKPESEPSESGSKGTQPVRKRTKSKDIWSDSSTERQRGTSVNISRSDGSSNRSATRQRSDAYRPASYSESTNR